MIALPVTDPSQTADVRRRALLIAKELGFNEAAAGRVGIVATELATNLVKFATSGEILLGTFEDKAGAGVEMIASDKGPGLSDTVEMMRDGYSTAGTPGTGLGAIKRLCRTFDIATWRDLGTTVLARIGSGALIVQDMALPCWGTVVVPLRGELVSGDGICFRPQAEGWIIFVADGLGHGPQAAQAAIEAIRIFQSVETEPLPAILKAVHEGVRHTRGAAVAVCRYNAPEAAIRYAGVGNIEGRVVIGADSKRLVSHDGTAGLAMRRVQEFTYPFPKGSTLVMHSDGLTAHWSASAFPGLFSGHPALAAAVLYRHYGRARDDASVIVAHASRTSETEVSA